MSYVFVPPPSPERALTPAQKEALLALKRGAEVEAAKLAEAAGLKPNGAALALRGLERRGLVARDEGDPTTWKVTFTGHALAERLAKIS
jgi:DNA-binding MarR family transcriptional regulator